MDAEKNWELKMTLQTTLLEKSNDYTELESKYFDVTNSSLIDPITLPPFRPLNEKFSVTVVIPAWNVESSILACLTSIEQSSFNIKYQNRLEVVVVDDGSNDGTWEIVKNSKLSLNLTVVRQKHCGQPQALNTGISIAGNDIIICCDADMVLCYYAIEHFVDRHRLFPNVLLVGFRSDILKSDLRINPDYISRNGSHRQSYFINDERITFPIPGWPINMSLTSNHFKRLGNFRSLWMPDGDAWLLPDLVFGALFSLPKSTYFKIGGWDERFKGWGCNDGYLACKAIAAGNYIVPTYAASGLHISHPARSKTKQIEYEKNRQLFFKLIQSNEDEISRNWLDKAKNRIVESIFLNPQRATNQQGRDIKQGLAKQIEIDSLLSVGEYSKVLFMLSKFSNQDKTSMLLKRGRALLGIGKYPEAISVFKMASALISDVVVDLAITHAANGQFSLARKLMRKFAVINPESPLNLYWHNTPAEKHIQQGMNYLNQDFKDVALRCFEAALIKDPDDKLVLKYRDQCLN